MGRVRDLQSRRINTILEGLVANDPNMDVKDRARTALANMNEALTPSMEIDLWFFTLNDQNVLGNRYQQNTT